MPKHLTLSGMVRVTSLSGRPSGFAVKGFTLVELLTVVSLVAVISGIALLSYSYLQSATEEELARYELSLIARAVRDFNRDMKQPPMFLAELMISPLKTDGVTPNWPWRCGGGGEYAAEDGVRYRLFDPARGLGWKGPYLQPEITSGELGNTGSTIRENTVMRYRSGEEFAEALFDTYDSHYADYRSDGNYPATSFPLLISDYSSFPQHCSNESGESFARTLSGGNRMDVLSNYRLVYEYPTPPASVNPSAVPDFSSSGEVVVELVEYVDNMGTIPEIGEQWRSLRVIGSVKTGVRVGVDE